VLRIAIAESRRRLQIDCRSVMFYYETAQCIINREVRRTSPHLFSPNTQFQLVDYFENNCFNGLAQADLTHISLPHPMFQSSASATLARTGSASSPVASV